MFRVIVPNKYPDIIQPLLESVKLYEPDTKLLIVANDHKNDYGHDMIEYDQDQFVFSHAVNQGVSAIGDANIICLNDDCVLLEPTFQRLDSCGPQPQSRRRAFPMNEHVRFGPLTEMV